MNNGATSRLASKPMTIDEAYDEPGNFLEIDVVNAETHGIANKRYTDYEIKMRVSLISTVFASIPKCW